MVEEGWNEYKKELLKNNELTSRVVDMFRSSYYAGAAQVFMKLTATPQDIVKTGLAMSSITDDISKFINEALWSTEGVTKH